MNGPAPSKARRDEVIDALRRGTVPARGLELLAVGLDRFGPTIDEEVARAASGGGVFKCLRGEWGSGKTFAARWISERARRRGFVTSEIQISETETPLHHLQTVYRRAVERLAVADGDPGAFRSVIDGWFYVLEEDVLSDGTVGEHDAAALAAATERLVEARLSEVSRSNPTFAAVLRAYRRATPGRSGHCRRLGCMVGRPAERRRVDQTCCRDQRRGGSRRGVDIPAGFAHRRAGFRARRHVVGER